jgi:hypothetical protein
VNQHPKVKIRNRLNAILRGAFAGAPTPLKDIPTKEGESSAKAKSKKKHKAK